MIKIKAWNARHVINMGCSIAKPAFIFVDNAEIGHFKLKLTSHDLFRGSLALRAHNYHEITIYYPTGYHPERV